MIGYKAFDENLQCRGFQYEVGKTYTKDTKKEEMELCSDNVFHFCRELQEIEKESSYILKDSRICEVISGDVVTNKSRTIFGTNSLTILREITGDEKINLLNSGNLNSGDLNSGDCNSGNRNSGNRNSGDRNSGNLNSGDLNSGDRNSGNWNSGDWNSGNRNSGNRNLGNWNSGNRNSGNRNSGDWNSGNRNSGNRNSGNWNSGNWNSGNWNSGDRNSGNWNSGNWNSGYCNSNEPLVRIFNKETDIKRDDISFPQFFYFDLTVFVSYDTATDEEREEHKKEIEVCGGFIKEIHYKDAWRKSWDNASDEDRRKVFKLPNWNNEVFKEISGIDVEQELGIK